MRAEFPTESQARAVLRAIGSGERTFALISHAAGGLPQATLSRALARLTAKRVVAATVPLSTRPSRETRYSVIDPHLRFWLAFLGPHLPEIERGRGDLTVDRIRAGWGAWRGRAIAPVVREALRRLTTHRDRTPGAEPGTPLLAVSRSGSTVDGLPVWGPDELLAAYPPEPAAAR